MGGVRQRGQGRGGGGPGDSRAARKAPLGPRHAITLTVTSALLPTHVAKQAGSKDYARERAAQELREEAGGGRGPLGFRRREAGAAMVRAGRACGPSGAGTSRPLPAPDEGGKQGEGKGTRRRSGDGDGRSETGFRPIPCPPSWKTPGSARAQPSPGGRPSRFSPSYQSLRMAVTAGKQEGRGAKPDVDKVSFPSASLSSSSLSSGDRRGRPVEEARQGGREKRQVRGKKESAAKDRKSKKAWKEKKREKKKKGEEKLKRGEKAARKLWC